MNEEQIDEQIEQMMKPFEKQIEEEMKQFEERMTKQTEKLMKQFEKQLRSRSRIEWWRIQTGTWKAWNESWNQKEPNLERVLILITQSLHDSSINFVTEQSKAWDRLYFDTFI